MWGSRSATRFSSSAATAVCALCVCLCLLRGKRAHASGKNVTTIKDVTCLCIRHGQGALGPRSETCHGMQTRSMSRTVESAQPVPSSGKKRRALKKREARAAASNESESESAPRTVGESLNAVEREMLAFSMRRLFQQPEPDVLHVCFNPRDDVMALKLTSMRGFTELETVPCKNALALRQKLEQMLQPLCLGMWHNDAILHVSAENGRSLSAARMPLGERASTVLTLCTLCRKVVGEVRAFVAAGGGDGVYDSFALSPVLLAALSKNNIGRT